MHQKTVRRRKYLKMCTTSFIESTYNQNYKVF